MNCATTNDDFLIQMAVFITFRRQNLLSPNSLKKNSLKKMFFKYLKVCIYIHMNLFIRKNLVWLSHNFLLSYITVEKYFIISIAFIFNLYFLCWRITCFYNYCLEFLNLITVYCLSATAFIEFLLINDSFYTRDKTLRKKKTDVCDS